MANVEYRRVGGGGGWPATFTDVGAAVDAVEAALVDRIVDAVLRLSPFSGAWPAGASALWAALRDRLPTDAPGRAARAGTRPRGRRAGARGRPGRRRPAGPEPRCRRRAPGWEPRHGSAPVRGDGSRRARRPGRRPPSSCTDCSTTPFLSSVLARLPGAHRCPPWSRCRTPVTSSSSTPRPPPGRSSSRRSGTSCAERERAASDLRGPLGTLRERTPHPTGRNHEHRPPSRPAPPA